MLESETKDLLSPCHWAVVYVSFQDNVRIGRCVFCGKGVVRINPETRNEEWLDGKSPWTKEKLRLVE